MALVNLGKVCITPKGAWSSGSVYEILDVVSNAGASYLAKQAVPAGTALSNTTYWLQLTEKGATGNGIASVEKTGTSGNIDTYTMTFTDGDTFVFTVANSLIPDGVVAEYYNTTKTYVPGDYALYDGGLYRCLEAATGVWDSTKWEATSIGADLAFIYAKQNGYYRLMTVGYADNLTPYSFDSGTSQNTPFILQGSGCSNGEEQADTGSYCQLKEKRGNTVVINQLVNANGDDVPTISGRKYYANINGTVSLVTSTGADITVDSNADIVVDLTLWFGSNDKIPTHLLNHPEDFFRYYQGDLSYNAGTLTDCNGRYLKTTGRNLLPNNILPTTVTGYANALTTEQRTALISFLKKVQIMTDKIYYKVDASTTGTFLGELDFYNGATLKFTLPSGGVKDISSYDLNSIDQIFFYGTSPASTVTFTDPTISIYYEGESGYDQTYPYEELANIDTGDEPLLAFDYKTPDGTIHRETNKINLGDYNYLRIDVFGTGVMCFVTTPNIPQPKEVGASDTPHNRCSKYTALKAGFLSSPSYSEDKSICYGYNGWGTTPVRLIIRDDSYTDTETFKADMSGVYLEYKLAESTTEQGTPFAENAPIDDFGTMSFDCPNGVPQGNLIFYPVDYKAEIDTLHNITDGDMHKIALKGDLAEGEPETIEEVIDYINARIPAPPAEDGTYNLTVTVASGETTYSWVSAT